MSGSSAGMGWARVGRRTRVPLMPNLGPAHGGSAARLAPSVRWLRVPAGFTPRDGSRAARRRRSPAYQVGVLKGIAEIHPADAPPRTGCSPAPRPGRSSPRRSRPTPPTFARAWMRSSASGATSMSTRCSVRTCRPACSRARRALGARAPVGRLRPPPRVGARHHAAARHARAPRRLRSASGVRSRSGHLDALAVSASRAIRGALSVALFECSAPSRRGSCAVAPGRPRRSPRSPDGQCRRAVRVPRG